MVFFVNGKRVSGEKKLNNLDFISIVGYSFYYKEEKAVHYNKRESACAWIGRDDSARAGNSFSIP